MKIAMQKTILFFIILILPVMLMSFGKNKIQKEKMIWSKMETMHFDIYYKKGEDEFGKIAAFMAEESYYFLKENFKRPMQKRIPIIFYHSHQNFETTNIIFPLLSEGVGGFTESVRNRVVVPFDGSYLKLEEVLLHELTHAFVNSIKSSSIGSKMLNLPSNSLPFWFSEGLPEYLSVNGKDNYNNMFIKDLILNGKIYPLETINGYLAYREGESFLVYISETYGEEVVMNFFYTYRISQNIDATCKKVFDMKFEEIQIRWKNYLKKKYFYLMQEYDIPYEKYEQKTFNKKNNSNMNMNPRFSPDGDSYIFYSNQDIRNGIWKASTNDLYKPKKLIDSEASGKFQEFHFQRNNVSWFPDGTKFAFVAKTPKGDNIYIMSAENGKLLQNYPFPDFDAIFEIDVSNDGTKIVLSAQKKMQNDLYIFNLSDKKLLKITDDRYDDSQPRWSNDDSKIVFTSERISSKTKKTPHIFTGLVKNIFYYDLLTKEFYSVTNESYSNSSPMWNSTDNMIVFISERDSIANFETIDIVSGKRAIITKTICGTFYGDLNFDDSSLIFSVYLDNAWNIYSYSQPLKNLNFTSYRKPEKFVFKDDFFTKFKINNFKKFGKRNRKFQKVFPDFDKKKGTVIDFNQAIKRDSLARKHNMIIDEKPVKADNPPKISQYKPTFQIDRLWGGMAYSSSSGTIGQIQFSLSDLMGDHAVGVRIGFAGDLKDSDFIFNYMYIPYRIDYGFGLYNVNDDAIYKVYSTNLSDYWYEKIINTDFGLYSLISYPFNKFWRADFENIFYKKNTKYYLWNFVNDEWDENPYLEDSSDLIYSPQLRFTHDNVLFGSTGPVDGWRGFYLINKSSAKRNDYLTQYADIRFYNLFAKRFSFASRCVIGFSEGKNPQYFGLDGYYGVRGVEDETSGTRKLFASLELRYPFIDYLKFGFPLPLNFSNIRGSTFIDAGTVWDNNSNLKLYSNGKFEDLKVGFGFGPRMNVGYFILKFDIAWKTDLKVFSHPNFYFSLTEDF